MKNAFRKFEESVQHKICAAIPHLLPCRLISLVRAESDDRDGFKLCYELMHEFQSQKKQHTLSLCLAQTLASSFFRNTAVNAGEYLELCIIDQYEKSSRGKFPSDLKTATLLRCAPQKIREFL